MPLRGCRAVERRNWQACGGGSGGRNGRGSRAGSRYGGNRSGRGYVVVLPKGVKLSASRSASSTLSGADDGRPLSAGSGINCESQASIAARSGATRRSRWFGRSGQGHAKSQSVGGMRSPSFPRIRRSLSLLLALIVCARAVGSHPVGRAESKAESSAGAARPAVRRHVPERADAVAQRRRLGRARQQAGRPGRARSACSTRPRLRERIFRADHREADALEAIELYRQAARGEPTAALRGGHLGGGLGRRVEDRSRADLSGGVSRAGTRPAADAACKQRAELILSTLSAYRPLPTVLAQIEREGDARRMPLCVATRRAQPVPAG